MPYTDSWLVVAVAIIAVPYIGGPLMMLLIFKLKSPTRVQYMDFKSLSLPEEVNGFVRPACRQLVRLGFKPVAFFCLPDVFANVRSINVLLVNTQTREGAMVNCIYGDALIGTVKTKYAEFITRFRDGVCVQTNNSPQLGAFRPEPGEHTTQFWTIHDVAELYRLHVEISKRLSAAKRRLRLEEDFDNDVEEYLQRAVVQEPAEYQVQEGLMRRVNGGYGLTIKGAILFTWQEMWPWKFIRKQSRRRKAKMWRDEIGETRVTASDISEFDD